jgi:hypothetical protein
VQARGGARMARHTPLNPERVAYRSGPPLNFNDAVDDPVQLLRSDSADWAPLAEAAVLE